MDTLLRTPLTYVLAGVAAGLYRPIRADWWGLIILGFFIVLYAFLARGERNEDRFQTGDNCYLIGFVYTLSIITWSLIFDTESLLGVSDGPTGGNLPPLLKTIGIALGTSVIGMVSRFFLTEGIKVSEDEFDRAVREAAIATQQLNGAIDRINTYGNKLESALDRIVANAARVESSLGGAGDSIESYTQQMKQASNAASDLLTRGATQAIDDVQQSTANVMSQLSSTTRQGANHIQETVKRAGVQMDQAVGTATADLRRQREGILADIRRQYASILEGANKQIIASTESFDKQLAELLDRAAQSHERALTNLEGSVSAALTRLNESATSSVTAAADIRTAVALVHKSIKAAAEDLSDSAKALAKAVDSIDAQSNTLSSTQRTISKDAEQHLQRIEALRSELIARMDDLQGQTSGITNVQKQRSTIRTFFGRLFRRHTKSEAPF